MNPENYRWEIDGDEAEQYVGGWMIVVGDKCIWRSDGVVITLVTPAK